MKISHTMMTIALGSALLVGCAQEREAKRNSCINILRQINANNQQYMLEYNTERVPTFEETNLMWATGYVPTCPAGGIYTQAKSHLDLPTCSLGKSHGHRLEPRAPTSPAE